MYRRATFQRKNTLRPQITRKKTFVGHNLQETLSNLARLDKNLILPVFDFSNAFGGPHAARRLRV